MKNTSSAAVSEAHKVIEHHLLDDDGLVSSLRPYVGSVNESALQELLDRLDILIAEGKRGVHLPISSAAAVFSLVNSIRTIAVDPDSMLVRNKRIGEIEWQQLTTWVGKAEWALRQMLSMMEAQEASAR